MRAYSIVFLDIDGTLLDSHHQVMPQTRLLLNRLERRGVPIVLCSARSPGGVELVHWGGGMVLAGGSAGVAGAASNGKPTYGGAQPAPGLAGV